MVLERLEDYLPAVQQLEACSQLTSQLQVLPLIWVKSAKLVSPHAILFTFLRDLSSYSAALADADPLGVNQNVTFDEVGGLDDRQYLTSAYYYAPHSCLR